MTGMERLNTCARMMVRGILGTKRWEMLPAIEAALLDNWDERSMRDIAQEHRLPEATLRAILIEVRREMKAICEAEKVTPQMVLARPDTDE
jgi:hypothetical protein